MLLTALNPVKFILEAVDVALGTVHTVVDVAIGTVLAVIGQSGHFLNPGKAMQ